MYGRIVNSLQRAGGAGTTATVTHNIYDATHCTFIVQDISAGGGLAAQGLPLAYVSAKGGSFDTITDSTAAGPCGLSALVAAPHSFLDIGPVVTGGTRNASTQVFSGANTLRPACRSLHTSVTITIDNGNPSGTASITHRLQTNNVLTFVSPTTNPTITSSIGGAGHVITVHQSASAGGVVTLTATIDDGGTNANGTSASIVLDVMVLARYGSGLHSYIARPHMLASAISDSYVAGARAITGMLPAYAALYQSVTVGLGTDLVHNLGASLGTASNGIVLFGHGAVRGLNVPAVQARGSAGTPTLSATLTRATGDVQNCYTLCLRPWSPVVIPV